MTTKEFLDKIKQLDPELSSDITFDTYEDRSEFYFDVELDVERSKQRTELFGRHKGRLIVVFSSWRTGDVTF